MVAAFPRRRSAPARVTPALVTAGGVLLLVGLAGCGSASTTLSENARTTLHLDVARIRAAAADPASAQAAVATFRTHVDDLVAANALDAADALQLISHAARIETRLDAAAASPSPSPTGVAKAVPVAAKKTGSADARALRKRVAKQQRWKNWTDKGNRGHGNRSGGHDDD
jgi:hypothetical protein